MTALTKSQISAISHVNQVAANQSMVVAAELRRTLVQSCDTTAIFDVMADLMRSDARVELNFHPDRKIASGATVAEELLRDGLYRNQFETNISNGSRSAHPGGYRYEWESRMFAGAYNDSPVSEKPKYGALNLLNFSDGSAPRFGSCYFSLRPSVSRRSTFSYGDSVTNPTEIGDIQNFDSIWSAIFRDVIATQCAIGLDRITVPSIIQRMEAALARRDPLRFEQMSGRALDQYVEAQVHGEVRLDRDVEQVVVDPSFRNSPTGDLLEQIATRYRIPIAYHRGFQLAIDSIPDSFRGAAIPQLARRIAKGPTITARDVGMAASALHDHPERWVDWGSFDETLQHIKQLWHAVVQFG